VEDDLPTVLSLGDGRSPVLLSTFAYRVRDEQTSGTLEALLAAPRSPSLILVAGGAYRVLVAVALGVLTLVFATFMFGFRVSLNPSTLLLLPLGVLASLALYVATGIGVAALTLLFKETTGIIAFAATGFALLGGVYFPVEVMPAPLRDIANALPFNWSLDVMRAVLLAGGVSLTQLVALVTVSLLALPLALLLFRLALNRVKMKGGLTHY
jgi:ABC-2 type transport system permease protein